MKNCLTKFWLLILNMALVIEHGNIIVLKKGPLIEDKKSIYDVLLRSSIFLLFIFFGHLSLLLLDLRDNLRPILFTLLVCPWNLHVSVDVMCGVTAILWIYLDHLQIKFQVRPFVVQHSTSWLPKGNTHVERTWFHHSLAFLHH